MRTFHQVLAISGFIGVIYVAFQFRSLRERVLLSSSFVHVSGVHAGQSVLTEDALAEILKRGAPILGHDDGCSTSSVTCDWMAQVPDEMQLVHMSLPGTHDAATWNYTDATQASLERYYSPLVYQANTSKYFQCQEHSLFQMLNRRIRVFDLRYAWNPGNDTVGFYHSIALLSPTTRLEDVFFGFYSWLDQHPTEAVLISLKWEENSGTEDSVKLQQHMYDLFQTGIAKKYWVQVNGTLGTLGEARGKLTLIQRFDYSLLPSSASNRIGIHLDPAHWTINGPDIELVYNTEQNQAAYIGDYYDIGLPTGSGAALNIQWKYNVTTAHLENATMLHPDQLYITFASSTHIFDVPPETPRIMALGNGTDVPGVNHKLLPWLQERKGKRFGIVLLDFFDTVPGLVEAIIGV